MPKPTKVRATTNPIGVKFHEVMHAKGIDGDYKAVADAFGVKTPSVYDWIDHARIGKDKYRKLVEWSGRSLHWWFDLEDVWPMREPATVLRAQEPTKVYDLKAQTAWPFSRSFERYSALSEMDKGRIDGYLAGMIDAHEHAHELGKPNGTGGGF